MDKFNDFTEQTRSWKLQLFFLQKLPGAWFFGIKVKHLDKERCDVQISQSWATKNPFGSIYFAALNAAAEFSTGALIKGSLLEYPKYSSLVTNMQMQFHKKATGKIHFTCEQGSEVSEIAQKAKASKTPQKILLNSKGRNEEGLLVAEMNIEWSIKI